ncbi:GDP-mannose mannosyl hydrolase [Salinimonas sediminis]|uniref:GDP-mannose mannosyl hydrolase n=1 Tax=Salinimonas sediminis TaxID=2303538 RepID=A0A346NQN4_9ALTE|nr:GDP-mannose mannosyl hydrolase [Salinimonas sediminis]AXR07841.1 GDP-mannose mannosyl hydrolase [Salinimonas sediminis]
MFLTHDAFKTVVENTPLVSIDLIVRNNLGEVLLGRRVNSPAKGAWFVPGGRIRKNESIVEAMARLCTDELGVNRPITNARFLGPFEHFYEDSVFGRKTSTHYIVLGYEIVDDICMDKLPEVQHLDYTWMSEERMLVSNDVHKYTRAYFID